jgi:Reverse transcriptase (RNA-dependent DNA polymerase)
MAVRTAPWLSAPRLRPAAHVTPRRAPNGKLRWLATLAPEAETTYAASVAAVLPAIERRLGPQVIADRSHRGAGLDTVRLAPWGPARRRWRTMGGRRLETATRALIVADVRDCFASIGPRAVARALVEAGATPEAVAPVIACLRAFDEDGVRGLPVGPAASAALGNVVLAALDDALERRGVPHLRWVDDVIAFSPSRRDARLALDELRRASARVGLALHDGKTRIIDDPCAARALIGRPNSPGTRAGMA